MPDPTENRAPVQAVCPTDKEVLDVLDHFGSQASSWDSKHPNGAFYWRTRDLHTRLSQSTEAVQPNYNPAGSDYTEAGVGFNLGDPVVYVGKTYRFPGIVCGVTDDGQVIVRAIGAPNGDYAGMKHIYGPAQLVRSRADEPATAQEAETGGETDWYDIGDRVEKFTGDYQLVGEVRARFTTKAGKERYVVEHDINGSGGFLHIYGPQNLRAPSDREGERR